MKFFFCILFFISCAFGQKIYINSADYEELKSLPLSQDKVSDLYDYIMFQGPLNTCYDIFVQPETKPIVEASGHIYEGTIINRWISE